MTPNVKDIETMIVAITLKKIFFWTLSPAGA